MCQRVVIALALACRPQLLIADEPTTGLDVTTQKAVMDLVVELTRERGMSTILITHDLGLAAAYCDRVVVMQKGHRGRDGGVEGDLRRPLARLYAQADARHAAAGRHAARAAARGGSERRGAAPRQRRPSSTVPPSPTGANREPLLVVEKLVKEYPRKGVGGSLLGKLLGAQAGGSRAARSFAPSTASASPCIAARASAWSASRAAASPPPRPWSCG